jgi:5-methylcytosine-specific restriction protein A
MDELLRDVLDNYLSTKNRLNGRATNDGWPDQRALLSGLPNRIGAHLLRHRDAHLFKVEGSIGKGNIANVPWVGVFRTSVTQNAENGYYIVLLFAEDMSCCCLSLNQGITAVEKVYTKSFAWRKMREASLKAREQLIPHPESKFGEIGLKSSGDLGRGYEAAAIESFCYPRDELPSDQVFFEHLDHLLHNYERLVRSFGPDLYSLFSISEEEFQQVVMEKAAIQPNEAAIAGGNETNPHVKLGTRGFVRSPAIAADAIRAANFACEIDPTHWTFTSRAKRQRYVEAHHLIPISQQRHFNSTLDVTANIICLCATCHRMLHFATLDEKREVLNTLLDQRKTKLLEKSIKVKRGDFLQFYGSKSSQEE